MVLFLFGITCKVKCNMESRERKFFIILIIILIFRGEFNSATRSVFLSLRFGFFSVSRCWQSAASSLGLGREGGGIRAIPLGIP